MKKIQGQQAPHGATSTLDKLPFNTSHLRPSSMVVQAFDGSRRDERGEIDLLIQIEHHMCQITFQVMDINPTYSCLFGRPWIHSVGVAWFELGYRVAQTTSKPRVFPGRAKAEENEARDVPKNKRSEEAVRRWFLSCGSVPGMGCQCRTSP